MKPDFAQYGFVHQENLIMACVGGSQAHGAKLGATDVDRDAITRLLADAHLQFWSASKG